MAHLQGGRDGCKTADEKVGGQSSCFECPFPKDCIINGSWDAVDGGRRQDPSQAKLLRNAAIRTELAKGKSMAELAEEYNLSERSIERIKYEV